MCKASRKLRWFGTLAAGFILACYGVMVPAQKTAPLLVAASEPDIEAIVKEVGGNQVETFVLFKGCILQKHLAVEKEASGKLLKADAIAWTGFQPEAGAVRLAIGNVPNAETRNNWHCEWIDVSKGAAQVDRAVSTGAGWCEGDYNEFTTHGDPFFRLNPENGAVMARDIAEGLAKLRPAQKAYFENNAETFAKGLGAEIAKWKEALKPFAKTRILCSQCGWENFAKLAGLDLVVCKQKPGCCPTPEALVEHVKQLKVDMIFLDPHTFPKHAKALKEAPGFVVEDVPSSIGDLPGATSYAAIFENFINTLQKHASGQSEKK
jgi:ABC-type Zn uptake system ZnuABC Zn-binding protein ZnuA